MSKHIKILHSMVAEGTWQPLSGAAQAVLMILLLRADSSLSASLSGGDLVKQTGKSKSAVWRALVELQNAGLIQKTAIGRIRTEANTYRVIAPPPQPGSALAG